MLQKIKDNLAIVVTAITLMGSIGAGIQSLGAVLTTLSNIDERMNSIEYRFEELRSETMVSNDIATLYEKVNQLEQISYEADQFRDQIVYLNAEFQNLDKRLSDLE
jgi:archaellum component FlaC